MRPDLTSLTASLVVMRVINHGIETESSRRIKARASFSEATFFWSGPHMAINNHTTDYLTIDEKELRQAAFDRGFLAKTFPSRSHPHSTGDGK